MVNDLFEEFAALPQVEAIALGGSRAGDVYDEKSDYDVYIYCTSPIAEDVRLSILKKYCSRTEIGNSFWEYEDNCVLNDGIDIDILYRDLDSFTKGVAFVVEQYRAYNGYTTCMWHNLKTCKIICDKNGKLQAAKNRFSVPYPAKLKENIIDKNIKLVSDALPAYQSQIAKAAERKDLVSICHRTAAFMESYFDIIWAVNELTHPGEKRLISLCKKQCSVLPADFEENINRLYKDLFTDLSSINRDIARIVCELKKIM